MSDNISRTKTALDMARERLAELRSEGTKILIRSPLEKLAEKPTSKTLAINGKCYQCEWEDADPSVKWRIGNCTYTDCALYAVRPYQFMVGRPTPESLRACR